MTHAIISAARHKNRPELLEYPNKAVPKKAVHVKRTMPTGIPIPRRARGSICSWRSKETSSNPRKDPEQQ
jgi:hypothetical protein